MSPVNVEEQLRALREQTLARELSPDGWPRLQRRLRRQPWRRAALVAGLALAVLIAGVAPGLLARRTQQPPVPTVDTPVVPGRPAVAARIRLDRVFTDVDVGFGATWVASQTALLRIDSQTNRVAATIPTPVSGESASIAFGEGAVWVTSGQANGVVYRVDPATNRVTATIGVPGGAFGIVVAAGTVWVTQYLPEPDPGVVARIDARTNQLLSPVEVPNMPGAIRYGLEAVWVTSRYTVSRIDPVTGQVVATIRIPNGVLIAFGLGTLWVAQDASSIPSGGNEPDRTRPGRLYRIDPATNRVLGRPVPLPGIAPSALAVGEGAVWVGELDGKTLTRFNLVP